MLKLINHILIFDDVETGRLFAASWDDDGSCEQKITNDKKVNFEEGDSLLMLGQMIREIAEH